MYMYLAPKMYVTVAYFRKIFFLREFNHFHHIVTVYKRYLLVLISIVQFLFSFSFYGIVEDPVSCIVVKYIHS